MTVVEMAAREAAINNLENVEVDLVRVQSLIRAIRHGGSRTEEFGRMLPEDVWRLADLALERVEDVLEAVRKVR